ncbi:MAG: hypothetical protein AAB388_03405 [Patescibacteria group bacterium]
MCLKKSLVAAVFIIFGFVATYVPQPYNHIETVEAGAVVYDPTNFVQNTATAVATTAMSVIQGSLWLKESVLDGIAWVIAKGLINTMVGSLVNWINSGFQGSPAFVQDLRGYLLAQADVAAGRYIQSLGKVGSFICSPFALDVQIAVSLQYDLDRLDQPISSAACTLSGVVNNIQAFTQGNFSAGGWDQWFQMVNQPSSYTPFGQIQAGIDGMRSEVANTRNEKNQILDQGDGFFSGEVCFNVTTPTGPQQKCIIAKPGKMIQEALSFNLDSGRQSLVAADEFNEILAALLTQLANTAITGASGLLGLSGGTGYTYTGYNGGSYTSGLASSSAGSLTTANALSLMQSALQTQQSYISTAQSYVAPLTSFANNNSNPANLRSAASAAVTNINQAIIPTANNNVSTLNNLISQYNAANGNATVQSQIIQQFNSLTLYRQTDIATSRAYWDSILGTSSGGSSGPVIQPTPPPPGGYYY